MNASSIKTKNIAKIGITAALYYVMTVFLLPISFSVFQLRLSEILNLLAFIDPIFAPGIILGCAISNLFSPLGFGDVLFGTTATIFSMFFITRTKNLFIATLWPVVSMVFIAAEFALWPLMPALFNTTEMLSIPAEPFLVNCAIMMTCEFLVTTVIGYPLYKLILKNKYLVRILKGSSNYRT